MKIFIDASVVFCWKIEDNQTIKCGYIDNLLKYKHSYIAIKYGEINCSEGVIEDTDSCISHLHKQNITF